MLTFDFFSWVGRYIDFITVFYITFSILVGVNLTKEKGYIILPNAGGCDHSIEWHGLSTTYWQHASKVYIFGFRLHNYIAKDLPLEKYQDKNNGLIAVMFIKVLFLILKYLKYPKCFIKEK